MFLLASVCVCSCAYALGALRAKLGRSADQQYAETGEYRRAQKILGPMFFYWLTTSCLSCGEKGVIILLEFEEGQAVLSR